MCVRLRDRVPAWEGCGRAQRDTAPLSPAVVVQAAEVWRGAQLRSPCGEEPRVPYPCKHRRRQALVRKRCNHKLIYRLGAAEALGRGDCGTEPEPKGEVSRSAIHDWKRH